MKKRLLFYGGVFVGILILSSFIFVLNQTKQTLPLPIFSYPTPTPYLPSGENRTPAIKLLGAQPTNGATEVDVHQPIIFTFNQPVATESVRFYMFPEVPYTMTPRLDSIVVTPLIPYEENLVYTYSLFKGDGLLIKATFSTISSAPSGTAPTPVVPLQGDFPNTDTLAEPEQRQNFPDVFLSNYTPYQNGSFSISSDFSSSPSGHYVFTVSPNTAEAKNSFVSWAKGLGMTGEEIGRLEIRYQ